MKQHIKSVVISALSLAVICAVVTAALAATNLLTKDVIAEQEASAMAAACAQVIEADRFEEQTLAEESQEIAYYEAYQGDTLVGYVFSATTTGKSSGLVTMTGVDLNGTVTGVAVTSNSETAGYIDKVTKGGLFDRLVGTTADTVDGTDAVSQATKSSNGVKKGVAQALRYFAEVSSNG